MRWRLGLDPGKDTGWAAFCETDLVESGSIPDGIEGFMDWAQESGWMSISGMSVVCERFVPEVGLGGKDQAWSLEIQGAVRLLARQGEGFDLTLQLRSDKAVLFGQEEVGDKGEVERKGWLAERGLIFDTGHAMDAATHVLVERKRARDTAFWKRYWQ